MEKGRTSLGASTHPYLIILVLLILAVLFFYQNQKQQQEIVRLNQQKSERPPRWQPPQISIATTPVPAPAVATPQPVQAVALTQADLREIAFQIQNANVMGWSKVTDSDREVMDSAIRLDQAGGGSGAFDQSYAQAQTHVEEVTVWSNCHCTGYQVQDRGPNWVRIQMTFVGRTSDGSVVQRSDTRSLVKNYGKWTIAP